MAWSAKLCIGARDIAETAGRLIKAIHAVPSTLSKIPSSSPLLIRIDLRRTIPLPFLPPHNILVPSTSLSLSAPLYIPPPAPLTPAQRREAIAQEARQREIERTKILTAPFRHFWYFFTRMMRGLVRVWSREGFVKVKIDGKAGVWRIDREGGWMLDEGRGIDRVVKGKAYSGGLISAA
ncbi:MAG: hypothetical protein M1839_008459 [Geoglossum umbratile]|nr:MAG: hypothetical protein M1839_008459 [Geoglossum umbratile]